MADDRFEDAPDDVPVQDRRRFTADGDLRDDADGGAAAIDLPPDVVPAEEARAWEQRARDAEQRLREIKDAYRAARADLDATRARLERDQDARVRAKLGQALAGVLAALDNFELSIAHVGDASVAEGIRLVVRQIHEALAAIGLRRLEVLGQPFDPAFSEAVAVIPVEDEAQNNLVLDEMRAGYTLEGQVLRPAKVRVGRKLE
ncbi:MAG: nucleotide exchange factor GrpE [Acidobacteria bacterium]|nr:nucleotide exchange factor GrpE [Acidobacteriota bacterium]